MILALNQKERTALLAFVEESEDAQALGDREYTLDVYDASPPFSLDFLLQEDAMDVLAAALLVYSDAMDGWYLSERIEEPALMKTYITDWLNTLTQDGAQ